MLESHPYKHQTSSCTFSHPGQLFSSSGFNFVLGAFRKVDDMASS
jgi:hypothetical protein